MGKIRQIHEALTAREENEVSLIRGDRIGFYRGLGETRYEVLSEVLLPYHEKRMPLQGGYLLVDLEKDEQEERAALGRVVRAISVGDLFSDAGEEYMIQLMELKKEIPNEVKKARLRYRLSLRLLGQIMRRDGRLRFTPGLRAMPLVGAAVGFPQDDVYELIAGAQDDAETSAAEIGHLVVGDRVLDGSGRAKDKNIPVMFSMNNLVARRTAVFARAGMGKSNFVKVLLTRLYETQQDVGTLIIDPEGEYAFRNASEPGLLDIASLRGRVAVFTDRQDMAPEYRKYIEGPCKVNFADIDPAEVVANAIPEEKQEMVFANVIRGVEKSAWPRLVTLLMEKKFRSPLSPLGMLVGREKKGSGGDNEDVILSAIVNNLVPPILRLHDETSSLIIRIPQLLAEKKIVILDVSMLSGNDAKVLTAWVLQKMFMNNQRYFTLGRHAADSADALTPALVVFEEAQFYLEGQSHGGDSPFVRWFKEGRKYKLGSILVTQQPGAIPTGLTSQCDNFFVFHLLSRIDLDSLGRANLHYAEDILTALAAEPIPGYCYLWSGRGLPFITCAKILPFSEVVGKEAQAQAPGAERPSPPQIPARPARPAAVAVPVADPIRPEKDQQLLLSEHLRDTLSKEITVPYYSLSEVVYPDGFEGEKLPAEALRAIYTFNLRFCLCERLERSFDKKQISKATLTALTEELNQRRIVREGPVQQALRQLGFWPPVLIGRAEVPSGEEGGMKKQTYYLLPLAKLPPRASQTKRSLSAVEVLP